MEQNKMKNERLYENLWKFSPLNWKCRLTCKKSMNWVFGGPCNYDVILPKAGHPRLRPHSSHPESEGEEVDRGPSAPLFLLPSKDKYEPRGSLYP